jgi:hypothetical protein
MEARSTRSTRKNSKLNVDVQDRIDTIETSLGSGRSDVESVGGLRLYFPHLWRIREGKTIDSGEHGGGYAMFS